MKAAAGRPALRIGHAAGDDGEPRELPRDARDRTQQPLGVGVARLAEQRVGRAALDDVPRIHDDHPIGDFRDDP